MLSLFIFSGLGAMDSEEKATATPLPALLVTLLEPVVLGLGLELADL
jgi:hypothetical protein